MTTLGEYYEFAVETAFEAGRLTLGYFQSGLLPDYKADDTPVTVADKKAEELIRARIAAAFPDHGVIGEEFGELGAGASHRWFVDPIDGTKAFMRGVPLYAVLIGLEIEGRVEVGAAYFPALGEMVAAATGLGCYWNGRRARVSSVEKLEQGIVGFTDVASFARHGRSEAFAKLSGTAFDRRGWSDAYGHALVATGRMEVMLDPVMSPWDCGPFPVILREAGGYFGDWAGNETILAGEALSTTRTLREDVLALIAEAERDEDAVS
jgi:myo-inositol-1(or 4)-monophosphatase